MIDPTSRRRDRAAGDVGGGYDCAEDRNALAVRSGDRSAATCRRTQPAEVQLTFVTCASGIASISATVSIPNTSCGVPAAAHTISNRLSDSSIVVSSS